MIPFCFSETIWSLTLTAFVWPLFLQPCSTWLTSRSWVKTPRHKSREGAGGTRTPSWLWSLPFWAGPWLLILLFAEFSHEMVLRSSWAGFLYPVLRYFWPGRPVMFEWCLGSGWILCKRRQIFPQRSETLQKVGWATFQKETTSQVSRCCPHFFPMSSLLRSGYKLLETTESFLKAHFDLSPTCWIHPKQLS